jgi:lysophospholipid acyltransferase (LPLAT)-like uncharacterized protein
VRFAAQPGAAMNAMDTGANSTKVVMAITPDGPRGPVGKMQPGAVFLAQKSGKPLVPVGISVERAWRTQSWDRFVVPKPFSRVVWHYGEPIYVGRKDDIPATCLRLEEAIMALEVAANAEMKEG